MDWFSNKSRQNELSNLTEQEIFAVNEENFIKLRRNFIVWASPKVLDAYHRFLEASQTKTGNSLLVADEVFREMRKDLGLSNFGIQKGDLVAMYVREGRQALRKIVKDAHIK